MVSKRLDVLVNRRKRMNLHKESKNAFTSDHSCDAENGPGDLS